MDAHKNLAVSLVATAPSPATSGTSLVVTAGHGTRFPAVPFNATIWPAATSPDPSNAEIVRVTNISTDTFTITRTQEGTSARTVVVGDKIAATVTAKVITDIEDAVRFTGCCVTDASQTISSGGAFPPTAINFSSEDWDTDAFHDNATNNTRLTVPSGLGGKYLIGASGEWDSNTTAGNRAIYIYKNATTNLVADRGSDATDFVFQSCVTQVSLSDGDYIELRVYQSEGANRDIGNTRLWLQRLGS